MNDFQENFLIQLNNLRQSLGSKQVEYSLLLCDRALLNCRAMSQNDDLFHIDTTIKEAIAYCQNEDFYENPKELLEYFMMNTHHRNICIDKNVSYMGVNCSFDQENKGMFFSLILE